jgi:hypothetical protein
MISAQCLSWFRQKWQQKIYKMAFFTIFSIFVLGFSLPIFFRKPLALRVINSIDIKIIEQINFSSVDFSLFRSFPFLNVRFSNVTTLGSKELGNSELLSVKYIDIAVDIWSVIDKSRPIYIRSIRFYEPKLTILISPSGQKNYEVPLTKELIENRDSSSFSAYHFNLALQSIEIINGFLYVEDENAKVNIKADGIHHIGSGDLRTSYYNLKTETHAKEVSISIGSSAIMEKANLDLNINFNIDNISKEYVIKDNEIKINELLLHIKGKIKKNPNFYDYDLRIFAPNNQFSDLIKLLPSLEKTSFKQFKQIRGTFNLGLNIKGPFQVTPRIYPQFNGFLKVENGSIQDYFNASGISDVHTYLSICNDANDLTNLEINIPFLEACVEDKDFKLSLYLKNPVFDPYIHGYVKGELNLNSFQKYLPLFPGSELKGFLNANIFMQGKMSDIDNKLFNKVSMDGNITLTSFKWKNLHENISIKHLKASLSPQYLNLSSVLGSYNGNALSASGKISNILAYFSPYNTLKGTFYVSAVETNLDKWIKKEELVQKNNYSIEKQKPKWIQNTANQEPTLIAPYDFNVIYKTPKITIQGNTIENFSFNGNYQRNNLSIKGMRFSFKKIDIKTSGKLLNAENYLFQNGILKGNLNISASKFPIILPSSDLVAQSNQKLAAEEPKSSLVQKIIPLITRKTKPTLISLIPERVEITGKIKIDTMLSADQTFQKISFRLGLNREKINMYQGIAYHENKPIYWKGILDRKNKFSVIFDFNKYQHDLFSIPKQSPLQFFNVVSEEKMSRPTGLKITGNIGNAPDYPFSKLRYLFYTNVRPGIAGNQMFTFNGLNNQIPNTKTNKEVIKWWVSYENKKFIFWPFFLQFKDIPFYFTGVQNGGKECYFNVKGRIPMAYFKIDEWLHDNHVNNLPEIVEVSMYIEDCSTNFFVLPLEIQNSMNENVKQSLEKYLRFELNKELKRIYGMDKIKNNLKTNLKEKYNYLPSPFTTANMDVWGNYYKINDSLQKAFNTMQP